MNAALTRKIVAFNGEEICDINWAELCKGAIGEGDDGAKSDEVEKFNEAAARRQLTWSPEQHGRASRHFYGGL